MEFRFTLKLFPKGEFIEEHFERDQFLSRFYRYLLDDFFPPMTYCFIVVEGWCWWRWWGVFFKESFFFLYTYKRGWNKYPEKNTRKKTHLRNRWAEQLQKSHNVSSLDNIFNRYTQFLLKNSVIFLELLL